LRTDLEVRAAGLEERRTLLTRRSGEVEERLVRNVSEREAAAERRIRLEAEANATARLDVFVAARVERVQIALGALHEERNRHNAAVRAAVERLDQLRRERATAER